VPAASRDNVDRNTGVEQQRLVRAAEIMQAKARSKPELARFPGEFLGDVPRHAQLGEREALAGCGRVRKHQCIVGSPYKRKIDRRAVGDACFDAKVFLALGAQNQIVVYGRIKAVPPA